MGGEEAVHPQSRERVDDEHVRARRVRLGGGHDAALLVLLEALQAGGEPARVAADLRPRAVGLVFAAAADRHLHQHGGDGADDHQQYGAERAEGVLPPVLAAPAEEEAELRQHADGAGERRRHGHDERVAVADMGELVCHHARDLLLAHQVEQPGVHGDRPALRAAAGGEGVGLVLVDDVEGGHGQAGALRQCLHHGMQARRILRPDGLGVVHREHDAVAVPPGPEVGAAGEEEGDDHALLATDGVADADEERGQPRQQDRRAHVAGHVASFTRRRDPCRALEARRRRMRSRQATPTWGG